MPNGDDKIKVLFDAVSKDYNLGTESEFRTKLADPTKRKAFFDGVGAEYDLGTYEDFQKKVGFAEEPWMFSATYGKMMGPKWPTKEEETKMAIDRSMDLYTRAYGINPQSQQAKQRRKEYEDGLAKGDLLITEGPTGQKKLGRSLNFIDAYTYNLKESTKAYDEGKALKVMSDDDAIKYINNQFTKEEVLPQTPIGFSESIDKIKEGKYLEGVGGLASQVTGILGGFTRLFTKQSLGTILTEGAAAALAPETGGLSLAALTLLGGAAGAAEEIAPMQYGTTLKKYYLQGKSEGLSDKDAIKKARQLAEKSEKLAYGEALVYSGAEKAVGLLMPKGVIGQGIKTTIGNAIKKATPSVVGTTTAAAGLSAERTREAKEAGYKISDKQIFDDAYDAASENLKFIGALSLVHGAVNKVINISKNIKSQLKNYVASTPEGVPETVLDNLEKQGVFALDDIKKTKQEIQNIRKAKKDIEPLNIQDETIEGAIAGKQEKKNQLKQQIEELQKNGLKVGIDEKQKQIDKLNDDIKGLYETGDLEKYDSDKDVPEDVKMPTKTELVPTIKIKDKEYSGADHGEAMMKAIEAGEKIPNPNTEKGAKWRQENGLFKEAETGNLLTRNETAEKYGIRNSSELETVELIVPEVKPAAVEPVEKTMRTADIRRLSTIERKKAIEEIGTPQDIRQAVMSTLINGTKVSIESFESEVGGKGQVKIAGKKMKESVASPFTAKKGAQSVEEVAHDIWEAYDQQFDTQEIRNEINDVLSEYTDMDKLKDDYISQYSTKDVDKAFEEWYAKNYGDLEPIEKEWELFAEQEGPLVEKLELSPEYIDNLIKQYEQEPKPTDKGLAARKAEGAPEEIVSPDVAKEEGRLVGKPDGATEPPRPVEGESPNWRDAGYRTEQDARDAYERERDAATGETFDEYIHNKNCGEV